MTVDARYTIVSRLAQGGMGELCLAREELASGIERLVVVKRLPGELAEDEEHRAMLMDEARILTRLSHPGVVTLLAVGSGDEPYLVLEWVDGPSLATLLRAAAETSSRRLPQLEAASLCLAIAETLAYVHDARDELGRPLKIIHRDLTPANVLIGRHGAVKLVDFGIARGENRLYATSTGVLKGTCGYMAPEQLVGSGRFDHRVDIFALGVLLYETTLGQHPFVAREAHALFELIAQGRYTPPEQVEPELAPDLAALIRDCMAARPERRPPTMRVVAAALREHLRKHGHVPTQSDIAARVARLCPPSEPERSRPRASRPATPVPAEQADGFVTEVAPRKRT